MKLITFLLMLFPFVLSAQKKKDYSYTIETRHSKARNNHDSTLIERYYVMYSSTDTTYNIFHVKNVNKTSTITYIPKEVFANTDTIKIAGKTYVKTKEDQQ